MSEKLTEPVSGEDWQPKVIETEPAAAGGPHGEQGWGRDSGKREQ